MTRTLKNGIIIVQTPEVTALVFPANLALKKSFSSDLAKRYAGGRWITISDEHSPLFGRHIYILPHADGTASVLVGGGPAMRHKRLTLKEKPGGGGPDTPGSEQREQPEAGEAGEKAPEGEDGQVPEQPEEPKPKPQLSDEDRKTVEESIKTLTEGIKAKKEEMLDVVRQQYGPELSPEEKQKVEKKIEAITDPKAKDAARITETAKAQKSAEQEQLDQIIKAAKQAILDENPHATGGPTIAAIVKENAEFMIASNMQIQALEKERKDLRRLIRIGKMRDKFRTGEEIMASYEPLSSDEIKQAVSDDESMRQELDAHYHLIKTVRGVEHTRTKKKERLNKDGREMLRNVTQGGYETITGVIGQYTGKAIIGKKKYEALGSSNAAILTRYYLTTSGHNPAQIAEDIKDYVSAKGSPVAMKANHDGEYFGEKHAQCIKFGLGADNIMTAGQAMGMAFRYKKKQYECFGQAEGALNQGAELVYALKDKGDKALTFQSHYTDELERRMKDLGLKKEDVIIKRQPDRSFVMTIPPRSFEKLIKEDETFAHGQGLGQEFDPEETAQGKANTDDFFPTGLNTYTPPEQQTGAQEKVEVRPHEQAACRFIGQQNKVYLNWEAGTGKSKTSLMMKAHLDDLHGKEHKMIVAMPKKVLDNYAAEVRKWTGYEPVIISGGMDYKKRHRLYAEAKPNQIIIVNHEMMNTDKVHIKNAKFDFVCVDEAHKATQREGRGKSMKSEGIHEIGKAAPYFCGMSGTATPNDISELYSYLHIADPEKYSSQKEFLAQFGTVHKGVGYKEAIQDFMNNHLSDRVMTLKKEVQGVNMNIQTHKVDLSPEQRKAYKGIMDNYAQIKARGGKLDALSNRDIPLTMLVNGDQTEKGGIRDGYRYEHNKKYDELKKIIDHHLATKEPTEKIGIFAPNNGTMRELKRFLQHHYPEYGHVLFNGNTNEKGVRAGIAAVTGDLNTKFSLHMPAGCEGLNIQHTKDQHGLTTLCALNSGTTGHATLDQFMSRGFRTGANRDVQAHLILSNTPLDLATELRQAEQKEMGRVVRTDQVKKRKTPQEARA